jgi:hypothetical protein
MTCDTAPPVAPPEPAPITVSAFGRQFSLRRPSALDAKPIYATVLRARSAIRRVQALDRLRMRLARLHAPDPDDDTDYQEDSAVPDEGLEEAILALEERLGDLPMTLGANEESYGHAVALFCAHWQDPPEAAQANPTSWYLREYTIAQGLLVITAWFGAQELTAAEGKS